MTTGLNHCNFSVAERLHSTFTNRDQVLRALTDEVAMWWLWHGERGGDSGQKASNRPAQLPDGGSAGHRHGHGQMQRDQSLITLHTLSPSNILDLIIPDPIYCMP